MICIQIVTTVRCGGLDRPCSINGCINRVSSSPNEINPPVRAILLLNNLNALMGFYLSLQESSK